MSRPPLEGVGQGLGRGHISIRQRRAHPGGVLTPGRAEADQRLAIGPLVLPGGQPRRHIQARLRQVIVNLAGNAIKFTATGGVTVRVTRAPEEASLLFAVVDTGIGIPANRVEAIFESFTQA
ncbi:MAG: hypothetical protein HQM02_11960, partial [Magnetococcales bacterium]|nr:hypothetical protein [Magnetococcales bacterium]